MSPKLLRYGGHTDATAPTGPKITAPAASTSNTGGDQAAQALRMGAEQKRNMEDKVRDLSSINQKTRAVNKKVGRRAPRSWFLTNVSSLPTPPPPPRKLLAVSKAI